MAKLLSGFVGGRESAYIFCTSNGKPLGQSNILRRSLHPVLERLGIKRCGFHAFRRFRNTYLRNYTSCPNGLRNFWLGWSGKDMSDHYDKIREDADFRREVAERVGIGLFQALGMFQAPANKWSLQRHEWKEVSGVPNGTIFELFLKSS